MNNNATKFIEAGFVKATETTSKPLSAGGGGHSLPDSQKEGTGQGHVTAANS